MTDRLVVTAAALWVWARAFSKRSEDAGRGTVYPTFRQTARRFGCTYDDIETAINDDPGDGRGLDTIVGVRVGGAYGEYRCRGEYEVEAY